MGDNSHADGGEQLTADRTDGNAHRRLACTRPFKDVTRIMAVIFEHARKIGMPRTNGGHPCPRPRTKGIHALRPVYKVAIHHLQGDRCAQRLAKAQSRENHDAIRLDLHAAAASVPLLTACQLCINLRTRNTQPRRHPVQNRRQCRAV